MQMLHRVKLNSFYWYIDFQQVLSGGFRMGVMRPLDTKTPSYNIMDLFFLGGPHTLRGFEMRSLGSRSDNDVLGGKVSLLTFY